MATLSTSALASEHVPSDYYSLEDVEETEVEIFTQEPDLEYIPEVSPLAAISSSYGVGTSYLQIFSGVARKLPLDVNYVYWREGQYAYCLAYGRGLELDGTRFAADVVDVVTYNVSGGYQEQASYTVETERSFALSASDYLVYSNLGQYPALEDGRDTVGQTIALSCVVALGLFLVLRIFRHCLGR